MWKLTPAVVAASALHVAAWVGMQGWHAQSAVAPRSVVSRHWQVRQVALAAAPTSATDVAVQPQPTLAPAPDDPRTEPPELQAPELTATRQGSPAAEATPVAPSAAPADTDALPDPYWPRPQLSRPPVPRTVVAIDFPAGEPTPGRHTAVLALYIDEAGLVQRVDATDVQLPGPYIEAARNAFLTTRFEPGEIQGRAVKSLIHVEVRFDQAEAQLSAPPTRPSRHFAGLQ